MIVQSLSIATEYTSTSGSSAGGADAVQAGSCAFDLSISSRVGCARSGISATLRGVSLHNCLDRSQNEGAAAVEVALFAVLESAEGVSLPQALSSRTAPVTPARCHRFRTVNPSVDALHMQRV